MCALVGAGAGPRACGIVSDQLFLLSVLPCASLCHRSGHCIVQMLTQGSALKKTLHEECFLTSKERDVIICYLYCFEIQDLQCAGYHGTNISFLGEPFSPHHVLLNTLLCQSAILSPERLSKQKKGFLFSFKVELVSCALWSR